MDILLIGGLWLDGSAWDDVVPQIEALGHRPVPVTLPGQGDGRTDATLDDQVAAVLAAVDAASGRPLVVGHSAACTLAWLAADARPDAVAGQCDRHRPVAERLDLRDDVVPGRTVEPEAADEQDVHDSLPYRSS